MSVEVQLRDILGLVRPDLERVAARVRAAAQVEYPLLGEVLANIVGAGGKTTTMYTLASELAQRGKRVITTTTTNIFFPQKGETDTLIVSPETSRLLKMMIGGQGRGESECFHDDKRNAICQGPIFVVALLVASQTRGKPVVATFQNRCLRIAL